MSSAGLPFALCLSGWAGTWLGTRPYSDRVPHVRCLLGQIPQPIYINPVGDAGWEKKTFPVKTSDYLPHRAHFLGNAGMPSALVCCPFPMACPTGMAAGTLGYPCGEFHEGGVLFVRHGRHSLPFRWLMK